MRSSVFWTLVRKDLYILRAFAITGLVTGLVALGAMLIGKVGFAIGGVLYLTANVAMGILIAMYGFTMDRRDQTRLFALSLPISAQHHDLAKMTAAFLAYGIPWLVLTLVGVVLLPLLEVIPRGLMVYGMLVQGCCLALFSALVAAMFVVTNEQWAGLAVITINILFSLFMVTLSQPSVSAPMHGPLIVWTEGAIWLAVCECVLAAVAVVFAISITLRKRDHL
jgi:ABC-2 type transport system permease protein